MKKTAILRHRRENLKKCSLRGLEKRSDFIFHTYPTDPLPDYSDYLLLKVGAPTLSAKDCGRGLFFIDGTWRLAQIMEKQLPWKLEARSLPLFYQTAYPRRQTDCPDPASGLATLEAIYIAYHILGVSTEKLLDSYHWKQIFLKTNDFPNS